MTDRVGVVSFFKQVIKLGLELANAGTRVCRVQIAAMSHYSTTYVERLYVNPVFADNPHLSIEVDKA